MSDELLLGLLALSLLGACSVGRGGEPDVATDVRAAGSAADRSAAFRVYLEPVDLETAVDTMRVRVALENTTSQVLQQRLREVITLRTWPEGVPIDHEVVSSVVGTWSYLTLRPRTPLAERWYLFGLSRVPEGFGRALGRSFSLDGGGYASRFRVGSEPLVWGARFCADKTGPQKLSILLSERVRIEAGAVTATPTGGDCRALPLPAGMPTADGQFSCSGVDPSRPIHFAVRAGLRAAASAREVAAVEFDVTFADFPEVSLCRLYYAPAPVGL